MPSGAVWLHWHTAAAGAASSAGCPPTSASMLLLAPPAEAEAWLNTCSQWGSGCCAQGPQAQNRATHLRFVSWLRWRRPREVTLKESGMLIRVRACRLDMLCRVASVTPNLSSSRDLHSGCSGDAG